MSNPLTTKGISPLSEGISKIPIENFEIFNAVANIYLSEDKNWGSDLDIIGPVIDKLPEYSQILDAGCGPGWHIQQLSPKYPTHRFHGVDVSANMIAQAQSSYHAGARNRMITYSCGDILDIQASEEYDVILCLNNTLGIITGKELGTPGQFRELVLRKLLSLLAKNGKIILSVYDADKFSVSDYPNKFKYISDASSPRTHDYIFQIDGYGTVGKYLFTHWFTRNELLSLLKNEGFVPEKIVQRGRRLIAIGAKI